MGWPEGASAVCGSDSPSASPTTCDVAAVPRNWHPPPGEAQARQPTSAAYSSVICFCAKRAPMVWTLPASSPDFRQQRDAARNKNRRQSCRRRQRHHHGRQALVAGGNANHALARGQRAHQAAQHDRGVVAIRARESIMPAVPCVRPSQGSVMPRQTVWRAAPSTRAPPRPPAGRLPNGRCGKPSAMASPFSRAQAAMRAQNQELGVEQTIAVPNPCPRFA